MKIVGITFPISLFWFAWTSYTSIHWIVPILASALWGWSFYTLILLTYTYTEDSYKVRLSPFKFGVVGYYKVSPHCIILYPNFPIFTLIAPLTRKQTYSASALAGIGLIRNIAGAGFPLFGTQMYHKLGNQGATSLLAGLAVLMVPIPFVFMKYGPRLREASPWARVHIDADELEGDDDEQLDV